MWLTGCKIVYDYCRSVILKRMSSAARDLLEQLRKLPPSEQREFLQQLLQLLPNATDPDGLFPSVKVAGGRITPEQVAEVLEDE